MLKPKQKPDDYSHIERIYTPDSLLANPRLLIKELVGEFKRSKELSWALFQRNLKAQFRQTVLGYLWLFAPPIATTLVWFFLNSSGVVQVAETGIPYPAFVMIGSLLWQAFVDSMIKPIFVLTSSKDMLTKLNFPKIAPVIAGICETSLISAVRLILLVPIFIFAGLVPAWTALFFPLGYLSLLFVGTTIGLLLAPAGLLYQDVSRGIQFMSQFLMYTAPVVYPIATSGVLQSINLANPVTYLLETSRTLLTGGNLDFLMLAIIIVLLFIPIAAAACIVLQVTIPRLIERMGM